MGERSPEQLWLQVGADIARALSALDAELADDLLPAGRRAKVQAARENASAALAEYRKLTPAQVAAYYEGKRAGALVGVRCGGCGANLAEPPDAQASSRRPCPTCGSLARRREVIFPA